jgi:hypothetical protein
MRRTLTLCAAFLFCTLTLTLPSAAPTTVLADPPPERCEDCSVKNFERYEQCVAVHGLDEPRCSDQYNEGVVICYRNFCEQ